VATYLNVDAAMIPILLDHGLVRNAEGAVFGRVILDLNYQ